MMEKEQMLKLENQLCFSIYACSREITKLYRPYLEEMGLTYPQFLVLVVLWEREACSVKELGEELYLDSGTLTPMLKRMEAASLIKRQRSNEDERKVYITLTEQGKALKEKAYCIPEAFLLKSGSSVGEISSLLEKCKTLLANIHEQNEKGE